MTSIVLIYCTIIPVVRTSIGVELVVAYWSPWVRLVLVPEYFLSTVGINPRLSDLKRPGTSKLDWRYLEQNKIDRN